MNKRYLFPRLRLYESDDSFPDPIDLFVSAGQSNESGRGSLTGKETGIPEITSFANDYQWKQLEEPADDPTGQVDAVSSDAGLAAHSNLLKTGKDLFTARGKPLSFVPCAKGGSSLAQWQPPGTRYDRTTLFGSMDYRISVSVSSNRVLKALLWMQGEADANSGTYIQDHTAVINAFRSYYGSNIPVIYGQLAVNFENTGTNDVFQTCREKQRLMETGSGNVSSLAKHYMIVTHDLQMNSDGLHLAKEAQIEIGRRRALCIRQFVYGEAVDGVGPRLVSISKPSATTVKVKTTQVINDHTNYDNYFTVYDNGVAATISSMSRDPGDTTAVLITLSAATTGTVTVKYAPPYPRAAGVAMLNVIKNGNGLPLPAFGPIGLF